MKKRIAAIAAAALTLFPMTDAFASAADTAKPSYDFVILGDSVANGFGRVEAPKYNYGEILADYYNGTVNNYAVTGDTSADTLKAAKNLSADQKKALADAEYVVISTGGNDISRYALNFLVDFCAQNNLLADGVTADSIPKDLGISEYLTVFDIEKMQKFALGNLSNSLALLSAINTLSNQIRVNNQAYNGIIQNSIIPNINETVAAIKAVNPNAQIIVQNVYQPVQLSPAFITAALGSSTTYTSVINTLRIELENIMATFNTELEAAGTENGFKVADVLTEFTAMGTEEKSASNPGHAAYFINIEQEQEKIDYHPNQKGQLAIAAEIIDIIGEKHTDIGLLSDIFESLPDKANYPAAALKTYESAAGEIKLGDVNVDSKIDARDASMVLTEYAQTSANKPAQLKARQYTAGKVNKDDKLDSRDASLILGFYAQASAGGTDDINEFLASKEK